MWRQPVPDVGHVAGIHPMPCGDPSVAPAPRPRKPRHRRSCDDAQCGGCAYSLLRSVAGTRHLRDIENMRGQWVSAL